MKYAIPEANMESLNKKLTRIANKAQKYGCDFCYKRLGEHYEEKTFREEVGFDTAHGVPIYHTWKATVKMYDIEVSGLAAINGWKYAATLEYTQSGNIISSTGEVEIPERYYTCTPWCEHCKTARDRKNSYIVYNVDSGEFKQVGRSCLKDFTGGLSAEAVAQYESYIHAAENAETSGNWWSVAYLDVDKYMTCVAETIRVFGYAKRGGSVMSTADRAEELYRYHNGMKLWLSDAVKERLAEAEQRGYINDNQESAALGQTVRQWIIANPDNSNYYHNLKVACSERTLSLNHTGLLASAFPAYNKDLEREAERREREAQEAEKQARSTWMGEVGQRISFEIADVRVISSWETQWGYTTVYKFTDKNGLEATWKTSSWVDSNRAVGKVIAGTVKELKEYRGIKQTELTRCKITGKEA